MKLIKIFLLNILTCSLFLLSVEAQEKIKVGAVLSLTGAAQHWSNSSKMGLLLAQEEINSQGGIGGKNIELIFEDTQTQPAKSVTAYKKLVSIDKVDFLIGDVWSFLTNPLIPLAEKDKKILISPTLMKESSEKSSPYFFSLGYEVKSIIEPVNKFFNKNKNINSLGILCLEDMWGQSHLKIWKEVAKKNGVKNIYEMCGYDFYSSYQTEITKLAKLKVDAVIVAFGSERALARIKEQKFNPIVLTTSDMVEAVKLRNVSKELVEDVYFTDWAMAEEFKEKFKKKFNSEPVLEAQNSFEALRALAKAIEKNPDNPEIGFKQVMYDGVGGKIDFKSDNFGNKAQANLYQVKDGEFVECGAE